MSTRDWRRLAHIREQQERMARLNLAAAVGKLREVMLVQEACRNQTEAAEEAWRQLLTGSVQGSHWSAMAAAGRLQRDELRVAEQLVQHARAAMEQVSSVHRDTVIDEELAQTLVERQRADERRASWAKLQHIIDEHTAASRNQGGAPTTYNQDA